MECIQVFLSCLINNNHHLLLFFIFFLEFAWQPKLELLASVFRVGRGANVSRHNGSPIEDPHYVMGLGGML